jgi:hypothetical protein
MAIKLSLSMLLMVSVITFLITNVRYVQAGNIVVAEEYNTSTCTGTPVKKTLYDLGCDDLNSFWTCSTRTYFSGAGCTGGQPNGSPPEPTVQTCQLSTFNGRYLKRSCVDDDWYRVQRGSATTKCNSTLAFDTSKSWGINPNQVA